MGEHELFCKYILAYLSGDEEEDRCQQSHLVLPDANITQNNTSSPHILYKFHKILLQIALTSSTMDSIWNPAAKDTFYGTPLYHMIA